MCFLVACVFLELQSLFGFVYAQYRSDDQISSESSKNLADGESDPVIETE
jgi:hypothetical protein